MGDPELIRNQKIYSDYQHNRNPFIDHPDFAEMVFHNVTPGIAWKNTRFTDAEQANPNIGGDLADPDQDDLDNLTEYFFNADPWTSDNNASIIASVTRVGTTNNFDVTYLHNRFATDLTVTYETSVNLVTWAAASTTLLNSTVITFESELVTIRVATTSPALFVRIRATRM